MYSPFLFLSNYPTIHLCLSAGADLNVILGFVERSTRHLPHGCDPESEAEAD